MVEIPDKDYQKLQARLKDESVIGGRKQADDALRSSFDDLIKQRGVVSALLEGTRAVLAYREFKDSARAIFDSCKNLIGATAGYVALLSKDGAENEVLFLDSGGLPCTVDPTLPMPIRGLRSEAYSSGKAVYCNDFSESEWVKFMPEGHARLANVLFAPLLSEGKAVGLLGLANKQGGFNENDTHLATAFGELATIALLNSQTLDALRKAHDELEIRVQERTAELAKANVALQAEIKERTWAEEELRRVNRAHKTLSRCNQALIRATEETELLHEICKRIVEVGGYRFAWVGFAEQNEEKTVRPVAHAGYEEGYLENVNITWTDNERGRGPTGTAIRTGKPSVAKNLLTDPNYIPWRAEAIKRGYASAIALPLIANGKPFGALNIYAKEQDAFDEEEIKLLTELADDLAYGIMSLRTTTERMNAVKAIRESGDRYRTTLDSMLEGIQIIGFDWRYLYINDAATAHGRRAKEELLGRTMMETYPDIENTNMFAALQRCMEKRISQQMENEFTFSDGSKGWFELSIQPVPEGVFILSLDITERKTAEEMRLENLRLEAADKAKSEFLASMSHELRTPLNAIIGFSELLKQKIPGELNEKQKRFVEDILTSGNHLLALINDILDLSKVEAGKVELVVENLSVPQAVNEGLTLVKEKAMRHNVKLKTELDPELEFIEADRLRFKQILFNLLSNAVKFSKSGGGIVTVITKKEGGTARISVSDTGIGIKEEDMGKLFKEFEQVSSGISRKYGGTGLGLAISKKLVELQGGKIWAESRYGEGSTFTFMLPLEMKKQVEAGTEGSEAVQ